MALTTGKRLMIAGLICAAGLGKRLGSAKPLLSNDNSTMLGLVLDQYRESELECLIVVLGHDARRVVGEIDLKGLRVVINSRPSQGLSSSIQRGLAHLPPECTAVMIAMGDMPLIRTKTINSLISAFRKTKKGIVAPVYKSQRGHPVILDLKYQSDILALRGDVGAKSILDANSEDIRETKVTSDEVITDVDTYEDWSRVQDRLPGVEAPVSKD